MKEPITHSEQGRALNPVKEILHHSFSNFLVCTFSTFVLILGFWAFFTFLEFVRCPLPTVNVNKFFDLGFFSFSSFSFIVFLTMIPFQISEGKLSPGFYIRLIRTPQAHFGLYVLMISSITCLTVVGLHEKNFPHRDLSSLFMAIIGSIVFAIIFHRVWVLRSIYQPYVVYKNIAKLTREESREKVWLELLECTYKAISSRHISYARNFLQLMYLIYQRNRENAEKFFGEDLKYLYKATADFRPVAREMEAKWPFLKTGQPHGMLAQEEVPGKPSHLILQEAVSKVVGDETFSKS